jgi:hypothetical protein
LGWNSAVMDPSCCQHNFLGHQQPQPQGHNNDSHGQRVGIPSFKKCLFCLYGWELPSLKDDDWDMQMVCLMDFGFEESSKSKCVVQLFTINCQETSSNWLPWTKNRHPIHQTFFVWSIWMSITMTEGWWLEYADG